MLFLGSLPGRGNDILTGAGATFPAPLYMAWFERYCRDTGQRVIYDSVGSGAGTQKILKREVDFGASDAFIGDDDLAFAPGKLLHLPTCVGAVAITCNLPGNPTLRLSPETLVDLFKGKIQRWSDPRLARENPDIKLPDLGVVVVHRADASGTTFIFSDYLTRVSNQWRNTVGRGKTLRWPVGMGADGNPGVADMVQRIPGAIGYMETMYATARNLPTVAVRNLAGQYVTPTLASVSAAAQIEVPDDTRVYLANTSAATGYPITGFTWVIFYREQAYGQRSPDRAQRLANLLWWMIHDGQADTQGLHYAPLPPEAVAKAEAVLRSIRYNGKPILGE
ncbi:MAG: phosphate ABC transporter substrate-binding protein PstS [Lentisphaerae bacterium RIFOXYB12_FULL_65_16]|nr:MAG: phosphate ABC transporter substrate-binding protein PstS [Lentisphaerae bacterium RIFOXYA12_64_32]OGV93407.1 MAG: phosphate ABC transporter substrate-binding protein PstS [Lentisphaerae bacterium RIFOXYB12_FULL_65_16]